MSQWTHIRGCFELRGNPWRYKKNNSAYLPYPEEQFKILSPRIVFRHNKDKVESCLDFKVYIYSLPAVREIIKKAFDLLPQGECGWSYAMNQTSCQGWSASSNFTFPICQKYFKDAINKMYSFDNPWDSCSYEVLKKYQNAQPSWIQEITDITVGIREDLRYCDGEELQQALEKFFLYLKDNKIEVNDGYLEWIDEYRPDVIYAWRCSKMYSDDVIYEFLKLDRTTNKIIHAKRYLYKLDEFNCIDWDAYKNGEFEIVEEDFK